MRSVGNWKESFCSSCTSVCLSWSARLRTAKRGRKGKTRVRERRDRRNDRSGRFDDTEGGIRLPHAIGMTIAIDLILAVAHGTIGMTETMTRIGRTVTVVMIVIVIVVCLRHRVLPLRRPLLLRQTTFCNHRHRHQAPSRSPAPGRRT